jgi:hypothetical protein
MSAMQATTYASTTPLLTATTVPYNGTATWGCPTPGMSSTGVMGAMPSNYYLVPQQSYGMTSYAVPNTYGMAPNGCGTYGMITPTYGTASTYGAASAYSANMSPDTASLINQINGLRSDIHALQGTMQASAIEQRGQMLVNRMNSLMADEISFRQQIAANPNLPNAQATANNLSQRADALNRDIASFNVELSMVSPDQRPYVAPQLNAFTAAYWNPTVQRFASYSSQFTAQASTAYQPAVASNPWLPSWESSYQNSINTVASAPQTYASANWWSTTQVLGSTEVFPGCGTSSMVLPQGSMLVVPNSSVTTTNTVCPAPSTMSTMPMTMPAPAPAPAPAPEATPPAPAPTPEATPPAPAPTPAPQPGTGD